jgi:hypothetical protein
MLRPGMFVGKRYRSPFNSRSKASTFPSASLTGL